MIKTYQNKDIKLKLWEEMVGESECSCSTNFIVWLISYNWNNSVMYYQTFATVYLRCTIKD